jgi:hypothetical protein
MTLEQISRGPTPARERSGRGLLEEAVYDERLLPALKEHPDFDLATEDGLLVEDYLNRQSPEYQAELAALVKDAPSFASTTKLSIAVPAYKEGENIYRTLENYAKMPDKGEFEVVILENHTKDVARDKTGDEIERFRAEHPDMQVVHLYKQFDDKRIGNVRKYLTDSILERKRAAGRTDSIIIVSNDADLDDINPSYAKIIIEEFAKKPELDAIRGNVDHPADALVKFPLMHATLRLMNNFRTIQRRLAKTLPLTGRNTALRSGIYAGIGGYNEHAVVGEDLEIGRLISHARRGDPNRMEYFHRAWLHSNPRREIESMLSGVPMVRRYDGFLSNEKVYDIPVAEMMKQGKDFSPEDFTKEIEAMYAHYRGQAIAGFLSEENVDKAFDRAMGFMRIAYHRDGAKIVVDDLSRLTEDLASYRERQEAA